MQAVDIAVTGDAAAARDAAAKALQAQKFRITWQDDWTAVAERGNKVANVALGAFAQYFKVGLKVMAGDGGEAIVRFERRSKGYLGGAVGAMRTRKNMEALRDKTRTAFEEQGILAWVKEHE